MSASLAERPVILNEFVIDVAGTLDPCSARELGVREDAYLQVVRPAAGSGGLLRVVLASSDTTSVAMRHQLTWTTADPDRWAIALDNVREDPDAVILHLATVWRKDDGGQSEQTATASTRADYDRGGRNRAAPSFFCIAL